MTSNVWDLNLGGLKTERETRYQWYTDSMEILMKLSLRIPNTMSKRSTPVKRRSKARSSTAGTCTSAAMLISLESPQSWSNATLRLPSGTSSMVASWLKWKIPLLKSLKSMRERPWTPNWQEHAEARDNAKLIWETSWAKYLLWNKEWLSIDLCFPMISLLHLKAYFEKKNNINLVLQNQY